MLTAVSDAFRRQHLRYSLTVAGYASLRSSCFLELHSDTAVNGGLL